MTKKFDEGLYDEELRGNFMDLVKKYAKPLCGVRLDEDEITKVADDLRGTFHGSINHLEYIKDNEKLRKEIKRLNNKLLKETSIVRALNK